MAAAGQGVALENQGLAQFWFLNHLGPRPVRMRQIQQGPCSQGLQSLECGSPCREYKKVQPLRNYDWSRGRKQKQYGSMTWAKLPFEQGGLAQQRSTRSWSRENGVLLRANNASSLAPGASPTKPAQRSSVQPQPEQCSPSR